MSQKESQTAIEDHIILAEAKEIIDWMLNPDHIHDEDPYLQRACYMHRAYELKKVLKLK